MWCWLRAVIFFNLLHLSLSVPKESIELERKVNLEKNFNLQNWLDCWQDSMDKPSEESDESLSEEFLKENRLGKVRGTKKVNKTLRQKDVINKFRRNDRNKKKRKYLLLAAAAIAAKAAAVSTALTILLPLALKAITIIAVKSFFVGTLAILMTSFLGFFRMVQDTPSEQKTIIYIHKHHKRPHRDFDPPFRHHGHFWSDTPEFEGSY